MNSDQAIVTLFTFGIALAAAVGFGVAWLRASRRLRQLEDRVLGTAPPDDRAERLEQAVDSLSAQVESLASGQEFLNRVLSDRLDKLARRRPAPAPQGRGRSRPLLHRFPREVGGG